MTKSSGLSLAIQTHYQIHDQENLAWDRDRINRLCKLLNITPDELAALIRIGRRTLVHYAEVPGRMPGAVKLLLDLVERSAFSKFLGTEYDTPLFPVI